MPFFKSALTISCLLLICRIATGDTDTLLCVKAHETISDGQRLSIDPNLMKAVAQLGLTPTALTSFEKVVRYHLRRGMGFDLTSIDRVEDLTLDEKARLFGLIAKVTEEGLALYGRVIQPSNRTARKPSGKLNTIFPPHGESAEWDGPNGRVKGTVLSSNDYLGLSQHPFVRAMAQWATRAYGTSASGSALLNGTRQIHVDLAREAAEFVGAEDSVLFTSGYGANAGWITGLARPGDLVLYDENSHASLHDGIRGGRPVSSEAYANRQKTFLHQKFSHNNISDLETKIAEFNQLDVNRRKNIFVTVEGVYSMGGDAAPAKELAAVLEKNPNVFLVIDDAHGMGVIGPGGRGLASEAGLQKHPRVLTMGTFSKSSGSRGGFVAGPKDVIRLLQFYSPQHMFSAAMSPADAGAALGALQVMKQNPELTERLQQNCKRLKDGLRARLGVRYPIDHHGAVVPIKVKPGVDVKKLNFRLDGNGFFVSTAEPPAVNPPILRISVSAELTPEQIDHFVGYLAQNMREEILPN